MMLLFQRSVGQVLRITIAAAGCVGIWTSFSLARADFQFQKDTEESVREAIRLVPDNWDYYMRLAQFDRARAPELLTNSLRLNPYDAEANIELGLQYEAEGDYPRAEKQLLQAYEVDHTYLPRWSLANYYFRRDNIPAFWAWARSAADMPADDIGALFELCWRVAPDPWKVTDAILNEKPELLRQYIPFLLGKGQPDTVAAIAPNLVRAGDPQSDRGLLFAVVNRLIAVNDAPAAMKLWRLLIAQHWVVADTSVPNNASFAREPLPVSFDWTIPEYQGLHSWPGSSGLATEFTGGQPESCLIAEQAVALEPGDYAMAYSYRTSDVPPGTGIRWQLLDAKSNAVIAESSDLSSDAMTNSALKFIVPPGVSILRMRLIYQRTLGTPRISGTLDVISTQIEVSPKS
jgi:tetratricopeptide (TPR) repeat protein